MPNDYIRELQSTDDFAKIAEMNYRLFFGHERRIRCIPKPERLKKELFNENDQFHENMIAYVSVKGDQIVAMAGVEISPQSKNGLLMAGVESGFEHELDELINRCAQIVTSSSSLNNAFSKAGFLIIF